ncbi:TonB-dependent receptor [Glaciecola sp. KUL10]|uniref:TonB-dependent receptor n=1 Tax=Glaciecola sp. (strain KUL10) TaxID=2161813 RepID=UPI000D781D2E|nr:TonB-dependent receptor [Glaciecola sp. KUL10]GBL05391.1 TonB-dependent receptor [Glaciecola sp. KUL10]
MKKFKPSLITAAIIASGMILGSSPVYAQEQDDELSRQEQGEATVERIEVTGFSTSLIKSLNQKRFSDTVSEQISADDLGGLPDVSMADALTRLPGISAVRTGGQAAEINIRGLSGDFVFSTLNGREQVSTSGSRSIEFDQYPSELISSAAVYKSPKASLIEGGVAGTVELKTASPLANSEQHTFGVNVRGMFNDRADQVDGADEYGHRLSFSYQGKYLDDTLGVALGYARLFQPGVATQFVGLAYNAEVDVDGIAGDEDNYDPNSSVPRDQQCVECELISEGFEMQHLGGSETRNGYMAALEWVPTDNFTLRADAFISKFDSEVFARGFRVKLGGPTASITNPVVVNNSVVGGTFNRTDTSFTRVELVNDNNNEVDEIENFGVNAEWLVTDDLTLSFDVSLSKSSSDFRNGLTWSLVGDVDENGVPTFDENVSISYLLNGLDLPDLAFNQNDAFTDTSRVFVSKYGIYPFQNTDELDAYRFDAQYTLDNDFISSIEVGYRYSDREYTNDRSVFEYGNDGAFSTSEPPLALNNNLVNVVNWQGEFSYFPSYLSVDLDSTLEAWFPNGVPQPVQTWGPTADGVINGAETGPSTAWSVLESGDVFETVNAAYFMANIDMELFDMPVTGNIGVRYVESKQASTALERATRQLVIDTETGETEEVSDPTLGAQNITDDAGLINNFYRSTIITHEFTDVLPSLNLNFALTDDSLIRFAAAKVMGRAPINRFAANTSTNIAEVTATQDRDSGVITLSEQTARISGNSRNSPTLEPFYATQYDLSYEYYFSETDGNFVAALFYKDIESFIENVGIEPFDFAANGFSVPDSLSVPVFLEAEFAGQEPERARDAQGEPIFVTVPTENGRYETAVNNANGGYIRGLELSYTQIYSFLPDLWSGLGVSASYSFTESEIQRTTGNGVFASSLPGLSESVATATVFWEYEGFETRLSTRYRDAFVSEQVAINDQVVNFDSEIVIDYQASYQVNDNTSVLFQINNLTDEPTRSFFSSEEQTGTIQFFGTQYFLGVTYKL